MADTPVKRYDVEDIEYEARKGGHVSHPEICFLLDELKASAARVQQLEAENQHLQQQVDDLVANGVRKDGEKLLGAAGRAQFERAEAAEQRVAQLEAEKAQHAIQTMSEVRAAAVSPDSALHSLHKADFSFASEVIEAFLKMGVCPAGYDRDDLRAFARRLEQHVTEDAHVARLAAAHQPEKDQ